MQEENEDRLERLGASARRIFRLNHMAKSEINPYYMPKNSSTVYRGQPAWIHSYRRGDTIASQCFDNRDLYFTSALSFNLRRVVRKIW